MKKLLFFALAGVLALSGCKKNSDQEPNVITMTCSDREAVIELAGFGRATIDWGNGGRTVIDSLTDYPTDYIYNYSGSSRHTIRITGNITSLSLAHDFFSIGRGCFTSLNASGCTVLTDLSCGQNLLTSLNASGCTALKTLDCSNNLLTNLDVSGCTALETLDCSNNPLTNLDVSGSARLKEIICNDNQLTSLNANGCTALETLDCDHNQLTSLDVSGCTELIYLNCYANRFISLDVSECKRLQVLDCRYNQMEGDALNALFKSLHIGTTYNDIIVYISQNPGAFTCDRSIAEVKGWRVY
jgi:Leucine-rich repeat (LRR) protein